jgi:Spy/CpxP family protein refolding chaperone
MKNTLLKVAAFLALASVVAMAQHGNPPDPAQMVQHRVNFLTKQLSLTPQQQQQATTIFTEAANNGKALHDQMRTAHQNLQTAIQKNDTASIDQLSNNIAGMSGQMMAAHAKAEAAFFQTLTPEQQTKMNAMKQNHHWHGGRHGHGGMGGPGGPDGPPPGAF